MQRDPHTLLTSIEAQENHEEILQMIVLSSRRAQAISEQGGKKFGPII